MVHNPTAPMRIAIVGNFALTGKQTMAERALPLAEELVTLGHRVLLALPVRQDSDEGGPRESNGVMIRYAGRPRTLAGLAHGLQTLSLFRIVVRWRPEVVYCFKPIAFSGGVLALFRLLRLAGLYRGGIVLDTDDWEGDGGWNELHPYPGWLKRLISAQERWTLRRADAVTVASRALESMLAVIGVRGVTYLPNATRVVSERMRVQRDDVCGALGLAGRPVVLLYTRFVEFEVERVLAVLERVSSRVPDVALLVVGRGLFGEEEKLTCLAQERGLAHRVVQAGWVDATDLPAYLQAADVAIYPMDDTLLNRTKCPAKLRDLLAAGVPVVADCVGQAAEYVVDGATGLLVPPGDVEAMARAVVGLLSDEPRRRRMGETASEDVRSRWSWRTWAPVAEGVLRSARAGRGSPAPSRST